MVLDTNSMKKDAEIQKRMRELASSLARHSARARLTGPRDEDGIYELLADCLPAIPIFAGARTIIDVGTGGGIPGLVLAICMPEATLTLVDSIRKKIDIVSEIARELELSNVVTLNGRSEDLAATRRERYDAAVARAVAPAPIVAEYLAPFVRVGGTVAAYKGERAVEEIAPAHGKWSALGSSEPKIERYRMRERDLSIVIWKKISSCGRGFPRKAGDASRHPWYELR